MLFRSGPFDASKANVARAWRFTAALPGGAAAADAVDVTTLVNGQLRTEDMPQKNFATARFSAATATKAPLIFSGVKAAWLDGKPLALANGRSESAIAAGQHTLTIEPDRSAPHAKAQCDDVTFLDVK